VAETQFDEWVAQHYQILWPELFDPELVTATVDFLAGLARAGPVLELGVGTGRIAAPLSRHGLRVVGVELSPAMARELQRQHPGADVKVMIGDFATVEPGGTFWLAYLLRNTITNLTTQEEQVQTFRNVAAHLPVGGLFVIENYVPELQRLPPGETTHVFTATPDHVGFEVYDVAAQIAVSHHLWVIGGELTRFVSPHRYVWPSELDLMARLAGLSLRERYSGWDRAPFRGDSRSHVSVWEKLPDR